LKIRLETTSHIRQKLDHRQNLCKNILERTAKRNKNE
jgi:hypothetical protein